MRGIRWNAQKNELLVKTRGTGFGAAARLIGAGSILDTIDNSNQAKYAGQKIFVLNINNYAWLVPFVEDESGIFLKTMIPSRNATKKYLKGGN